MSTHNLLAISHGLKINEGVRHCVPLLQARERHAKDCCRLESRCRRLKNGLLCEGHNVRLPGLRTDFVCDIQQTSHCLRKAMMLNRKLCTRSCAFEQVYTISKPAKHISIIASYVLCVRQTCLFGPLSPCEVCLPPCAHPVLEIEWPGTIAIYIGPFALRWQLFSEVPGSSVCLQMQSDNPKPRLSFQRLFARSADRQPR